MRDRFSGSMATVAVAAAAISALRASVEELVGLAPELILYLRRGQAAVVATGDPTTSQ